LQRILLSKKITKIRIIGKNIIKKDNVIKKDNGVIKKDNGVIKKDKIQSPKLRTDKEKRVPKETITKETITKENNTTVRSKKNAPHKKKKINFNFNKEEWENITPKDIERWKEAYPACDIKVELAQMREWLKANPDRRKKNYRRFITNWLSRSQERGGSKKKGRKSFIDMELERLEKLEKEGKNDI